MTEHTLVHHLSTAEEALSGFLEMLLGSTVSLQLQEPAAARPADVEAQAGDHVALLGQVESKRFAVLLEVGWVPLLAQATLGEPLQSGDAGADDLVGEMAAQGYGAVQSGLAGADVTLGAASFDVHTSAEALPPLADELVRVAFSIEHDGKALGGFAVFPVSQEAEPDASPVSGSPSDEAFEAPSSGSGPAPGGADSQRMAAQPPGAAPPSRRGQPASVSRVAFPDLGIESIGGDGDANFGLLAEVELELTVELGRRRLPLSDLLQLKMGSVVELEKLVGEPLEVYANGRLIAEGEAVVIDEQFGVRITSLASRRRDRAFV